MHGIETTILTIPNLHVFNKVSFHSQYLTVTTNERKLMTQENQVQIVTGCRYIYLVPFFTNYQQYVQDNSYSYKSQSEVVAAI